MASTIGINRKPSALRNVTRPLRTQPGRAPHILRSNWAPASYTATSDRDAKRQRHLLHISASVFNVSGSPWSTICTMKSQLQRDEFSGQFQCGNNQWLGNRFEIHGENVNFNSSGKVLQSAGRRVSTRDNKHRCSCPPIRQNPNVEYRLQQRRDRPLLYARFAMPRFTGHLEPTEREQRQAATPILRLHLPRSALCSLARQRRRMFAVDQGRGG